LFEALKNLNRQDILIVVGGVIPKQDYDYLYDAGAVGIFGPGTPIAESANEILEILIKGQHAG
jgi:methylmalonyl-CoA mutase